MPTRRAFIRDSALWLGAAGAAAHLPRHAPSMTLGLITDVHYADKGTRGTRHYRDSLRKMTDAIEHLRERVDVAVELGDFIDAAGSSADDETVALELSYLREIEAIYRTLPVDRHYVLGNHCVDILTKDEFIEHSGAHAPSYSFDHKGDGLTLHVVILDACFSSNGEPYGRKNSSWRDSFIPKPQLDWLRDDLEATAHPVVVLTHQRLDPTNNYTVSNAERVREVLERSGKVMAVFQGHSHDNEHRTINDIHYCVVHAMVEGSAPRHNGAARVEVFPDRTIAVHGFAKQDDYVWEP